MEQAYQNFNAGKYKEAFNNLSSNPSNIDSYQPNLTICEYLANRCQPAANNCTRKLNDLLSRKFKRDQPTDLQTQSIVKLNLAVLLILQGRRDAAILLLENLYKQKDCFVQFMQSRIFLLLMELHNFARNSVESLTLYRFYLLKPTDQRGHSQQWTSLVLHEHGKTFTVAKEEFHLVSKALTNQALLQLGAPSAMLSNLEEDEKMREELMARARRRKNSIGKYYETNLVLLSRFNQALRSLHSRNYSKCLSLMNFSTIAEDYEQMPTTKIITNIVSAFVNNNAAVVHMQLNMPAISLAYLNKAKALLTKACTGVQDKDLHLLSLNYGSYIDSITYNQAVAMMTIRPKQSYAYFQSIKKSNQMARSYKFWYRMAQSVLQYYHMPKLQQEKKSALLNTALSSLTNALLCLDKLVIPTSQQLKNITNFTNLQEEDIEAIIMKMKAESLRFRHSTLTLMCYVSLGLGLWRKVIRIGQPLLEDKKFDQKNRVNVLHYVIEAQSQLGKSTLILRQYLDHLQAQLSRQHIQTESLYLHKDQDIVQKTDFETLFYHQLMKIHLSEGNYTQAYKCCEYIRMKHSNSLSQSMRDSMKAMHIRYHLDQKFIKPYLKVV